MFQPTLFFSVLFSLVSASIYFYVGYRLSQRRIASPDTRLAWNLLIVWWYCLAASTLINGLRNFLGLLNITDLALFITFSQVSLLAICVSLYGLLYYLLYLFTGNRKLLTPLTLFYIVYFILLLYYINSLIPIGITLERWNTSIQYQEEATGPFFIIILLFLIFPQIIGSLAYFTLFFRVENTTQKYRIALVSWSIIIWFGASFLASITGFGQQDWWQITSRLLGLAAALAILMAYEPLPWLKQRLGVTSIGETTGD